MGGAVSAASKAVALSVDGQQQIVHVWGRTVQDVLDANDIDVSAADELTPAANSPVFDGAEIAINYVRPITVITDGVSQTYWTTATSVAQALAEIGLHDPATRLSVDRSTPLGRDGLPFSASTPKTVHLTVDGQTTDTTTTAADVQSLLNEAGIQLGVNDRISLGRTATPPEGDTVELHGAAGAGRDHEDQRSCTTRERRELQQLLVARRRAREVDDPHDLAAEVDGHRSAAGARGGDDHDARAAVAAERRAPPRRRRSPESWPRSSPRYSRTER